MKRDRQNFFPWPKCYQRFLPTERVRVNFLQEYTPEKSTILQWKAYTWDKKDIKLSRKGKELDLLERDLCGEMVTITKIHYRNISETTIYTLYFTSLYLSVAKIENVSFARSGASA